MSTVGAQTSATTYKLREVKNGFGAEIRGFDFTNGVRDEEFRVLQDAVTKVRNLKPLYGGGIINRTLHVQLF